MNKIKIQNKNRNFSNLSLINWVLTTNNKHLKTFIVDENFGCLFDDANDEDGSKLLTGRVAPNLGAPDMVYIFSKLPLNVTFTLVTIKI